jgi:hypothetical protein
MKFIAYEPVQGVQHAGACMILHDSFSCLVIGDPTAEAVSSNLLGVSENRLPMATQKSSEAVSFSSLQLRFGGTGYALFWDKP